MLMKQRILTAIIGLIIFIPIIWYGKLPFIITVYLLASIALYELMKMYFIHSKLPYLILATIFLWLFMLPFDSLALGQVAITKLNIIIIFLVILLIITVLTKNHFTFDNAAFVLLATLYISIAFFVIITLRFSGLNYFLFVLFLVWTTDSAAYFSGRFFGKHKLWPAISPNKTIEGAIGGVIAATVVGLLFHVIYPFDQSIMFIIIYALIISVVGQLGDLVASAIKRHYDVKDFGRIFPGHGGILDRLDSLLFVLIVLYVIQFTS